MNSLSSIALPRLYPIDEAAEQAAMYNQMMIVPGAYYQAIPTSQASRLGYVRIVRATGERSNLL